MQTHVIHSMPDIQNIEILLSRLLNVIEVL